MPYKGTKHHQEFGIVAINLCLEDDLDEVMAGELSNDDLVVVTVENDVDHAEAMKRQTEYSLDTD